MALVLSFAPHSKDEGYDGPGTRHTGSSGVLRNIVKERKAEFGPPEWREESPQKISQHKYFLYEKQTNTIKDPTQLAGELRTPPGHVPKPASPKLSGDRELARKLRPLTLTFSWKKQKTELSNTSSSSEDGKLRVATVCFSYCFETGSHYVALVVLELTM